MSAKPQILPTALLKSKAPIQTIMRAGSDQFPNDLLPVPSRSTADSDKIGEEGRPKGLVRVCRTVTIRTTDRVSQGWFALFTRR